MEKLLKKDISDLKIGELENLIDYLNKEYHNGVEKVDDTTYEKYLSRLRKLKPKSRFLREIGAPLREELVKVKLPLWMGSMDNSIFPDVKPLKKWIKKYPGPYFCSAKLDGASALYGNKQLYTRGKEGYGQDISYLLDYLNLPELDDGVYVRGELIMNDKTFQKKYASEFPKARSIISGTINSKKPKPEILRDISFVAFEYAPKEELSPEEQFDMLEELGFLRPVNQPLIPSDDLIQELILLFQTFKSESPYEIDGVIVCNAGVNIRNTSGSPDFAIAFKMNPEGKRTTIEEVIWDPSMYGVLVPTVRFHTVVIGGDNVSYASAFNAKYVVDHHLRKGIEIKIVKSGDVIPYIQEVINDKESMITGRGPDMPDDDEQWEWNESGVDIILTRPLENKIVLRKRLLRFFTAMEIKYINIGIVKKMIAGGIDTPRMVFKTTEEDFMKLESVKERSAKKYYTSIHEILDNPVPLERVMKASLAFGSGFGERKLYPLVSSFNMIDVDGQGKVVKMKRPKRSEIVEIEGFSEKMAEKFIEGWFDFVSWMKENPWIRIKKASISENESDDLKDYYIYFTGGKDKALEEKLKSHGANIQNGFSGKTNLLVIKNRSTNNNKVEKAKEKGIKIMIIDQVERELF